MQIDKRVWKFPIKHGVEMPERAEILRVGLQNGEPFLWALVCSAWEKKETRNFEIFGTGHAIPLSAGYIGGYSEGPFEWHVFELSNQK